MQEPNTEPPSALPPDEPTGSELWPPAAPAADVAPARPSLARHTRHKRIAKERHSRVVRAAGWMLAVAILQVVFGLFAGMSASREAAAAHRNLQRFEPDELVELEDGTTMTAGELARAVDRERLQAYIVPIGLGMVFLLLAWWATKAALPAIMTALALFVSVHVVMAILDPANIVRGLLIKILFIAALLRGLMAALEQRDARRKRAAAAPA